MRPRTLAIRCPSPGAPACNYHMLSGSLGSPVPSSPRLEKSSEYWMAGFENCAILKRPSDTELAKNARLVVVMAAEAVDR